MKFSGFMYTLLATASSNMKAWQKTQCTIFFFFFGKTLIWSILQMLMKETGFSNVWIHSTFALSLIRKLYHSYTVARKKPDCCKLLQIKPTLRAFKQNQCNSFDVKTLKISSCLLYQLTSMYSINEMCKNSLNVLQLWRENYPYEI